MARRSILIIGGGTAGWLTAAYLARMLQGSAGASADIVLVESPDIAPIGVGEGAFPTLRDTLRFIGVDEAAFVRGASGTFKQGIRFTDWVRTPGRIPVTRSTSAAKSCAARATTLKSSGAIRMSAARPAATSAKSPGCAGSRTKAEIAAAEDGVSSVAAGTRSGSPAWGDGWATAAAVAPSESPRPQTRKRRRQWKVMADTGITG